MTTIRELFHEIGNWHNKISVCAGVTRAILKQKLKDNPKNSKEIEETFKKLAELEQHALGADKALIQLKDIIYNVIDPDTDKPKK